MLGALEECRDLSQLWERVLQGDTAPDALVARLPEPLGQMADVERQGVPSSARARHRPLQGFDRIGVIQVCEAH